MTQDSQRYRILVEPIPGRIEARHNGHIVASSLQAKMMHETRLEPCLYFPASDTNSKFLIASNHRTFCPFKGTASFFDLQLPGERIDKAAWTYKRALPEASDVQNHIGFMPGVLDQIDAPEGLPAKTDDGHLGGALADWLMRDAPFSPNPIAFTRQLAEQMLSDGIAISRLSVLIWSLHPEFAGKNYVWRDDRAEVSEYNPSHSNLTKSAYINSPLRYVAEGLGGVRQILNPTTCDAREKPEFNFPIMEELRAEGATDYVAMPLVFSNGQINVVTLTSKHPKGFTTANLGLIFECLGMISRHYEVYALKDNTTNLLNTYLGPRSGARVLDGKTHRGDGDDIEAAILVCDLRRSSSLAEQLPNVQYLALLNSFFDIVTLHVEDKGGEILKFIGDAVLAIFPVDGCTIDPCRRASNVANKVVDAIQQMDLEATALPSSEAPLSCAIGLDFGTVTYGNIGAANRLDFTVIGRAAIVASRLSDLAKTQDVPILATRYVADAAECDFTSIGDHLLRNISDPVELLTPVITTKSTQLEDA